MDNKCLQHVKNFKYLDCEICYEYEKVNHKTSKTAQLLGILNNTFKPTLIQKFSRIKVYNVLNLQIILYESEILNLRKNYKRRFTPIAMKFFRRTAGYTLFDQKRNEEILEEFKVVSVDEKLRRYK
jgi:hypothetical protein